MSHFVHGYMLLALALPLKLDFAHGLACLYNNINLMSHLHHFFFLTRKIHLARVMKVTLWFLVLTEIETILGRS